MTTKTGIMLGLGKSRQELLQTMQDLAERNVDILTLGQYLQPTKKHLPVERFVTPDEFESPASQEVWSPIKSSPARR